MPRRESHIEADHVKEVKRDGGEAYKFVSPGRVGVPDRINLYGADRMVELLLNLIDERLVECSNLSPKAARFECERLLNAALSFTEVKTDAGKLSAPQKREHARLRKRGFTVYVLKDIK